jgi:hypothetical protein
MSPIDVQVYNLVKEVRPSEQDPLRYTFQRERAVNLRMALCQLTVSLLKGPNDERVRFALPHMSHYGLTGDDVSYVHHLGNNHYPSFYYARTDSADSRPKPQTV